MTPKSSLTNALKAAEAAWLNDTPAPHSAPPDRLTAALDALYARGPAASARAQARLRRALREAQPRAVYYEVLPRTPIGPIDVAVSEFGLMRVRFGLNERDFALALRAQTGVEPVRAPARTRAVAQQLRDYLTGQRTRFDFPVDLSGLSEFQRRVLLAACQVPRGQVATYSDIARRIGRPKAARAVGQALSHNPVPIVVPCHRVLAADGSLRGYLGSAGTQTKEALLRLEGAR